MGSGPVLAGAACIVREFKFFEVVKIIKTAESEAEVVETKAQCKLCKKLFVDSIVNGTSAVVRMRDHITACPSATAEQKSQHGSSAAAAYRGSGSTGSPLGSMRQHVVSLAFPTGS